MLQQPVEFIQFTSICYGERLAEIGAVPSIGSIGDSFDNALAETVNGYYKAELVRGPEHPGPWKTIEELELATLGWVHWHNNERLHGFIGDVPPAEFEETFYAATHQAQVLAENTTLGSLQNPGRFKPWRNGFVESFNWKLRDECLNVNQFYSLDHARGIIGIWKEEYNTIRPPSSLGYSTPSVYAGQCTH